jgi:hypothetical protein
MVQRPLLALLLALVLAGCDQTEGECTPMDTINADGKPLGADCTKNDECKYNWCYLGSSFTGADASVGFCSRRCSCGEDCADEGYFLDESGRETTEALFACQRPSTSSGATDVEKAFCVPRCESAADCGDYSDLYTACKAPETGTPKKLCHIE